MNGLGSYLFPVPQEVARDLDPRTIEALRKQSLMQLGLGMMAARDKGAGLGGGIAAALQQAQQGLGAGLGQAYAANRGRREEQRLDLQDRRLASTEDRAERTLALRQSESDENRRFREQQAIAQQQFQAEQNALNRQLRQEQFEARSEESAINRQSREDIQRQGLELRQDLAAEKREVRERERRFKAADDIDAVDKMRAEVTDLINAPGFSTIYGKSRYLSPSMLPGGKGADAEARRLQLEGASFGIAIQKMRGLGQLSDAEGKKITAAYTRATNPNQSEESARKGWQEVLDTLELARERAANRGGISTDGGWKIEAAD